MRGTVNIRPSNNQLMTVVSIHRMTRLADPVVRFDEEFEAKELSRINFPFRTSPF